MDVRTQGPVLTVDSVDVVRAGRTLLGQVELTVRAGEQWALLGPNGAGKSTLLALCGARAHPTAGRVEVLGHRLGRVDMFTLRRHIGHVDPRSRIEPDLTVRQAVLTGLVAAADLPRRFDPTPAQLGRAEELIDGFGLRPRTDAPWSVLSQGERGRALIARALVGDPDLLLLDEPTTGLDLAARELLLGALADLHTRRPQLASVTVTHHLEELPASTTHALVLDGGRVLAAGPVDQVVTSAVISRAFGVDVEVERRRGRWSAIGAAPQ